MPSPRITTLLVLTLGAALPGCRSSTRSSAEASPVAPALAASASTKAPGGPSPLDQSLGNPRDIVARFQSEAQNRPTGSPRVEEVLGALKKAGVSLSAERQHLASPFGARFCIGARASEQLSLSVCEYDNEASAAAGREASARALAAIPNREVIANRTATLTVRLQQKTPESDALRERMVDTFVQL